MRRNPDDPLARGQQRLLKPAGDMPAVLDRPHAFVIQTACPPHRGQMPGIVGRDLPAAANLAGSLVHASERVLALVCVSTPITIICTIPSLGLWSDGADLRRTHLSRGDATLL